MAASRSHPARKGAPGRKTSGRPTQIFVSYARKDSAHARQVADALRAAGFEPWLEEQQVNPGENWPQAIGNAIEKSDGIVLLVSKAFLASPRLVEEWNYAIGSRRHAGRVIPIVAPGTPDDSIPWILKRLPHVKAGSDWKRTGRRAASELLRQIEEAD